MAIAGSKKTAELHPIYLQSITWQTSWVSDQFHTAIGPNAIWLNTMHHTSGTHLQKIVKLDKLIIFNQFKTLLTNIEQCECMCFL